MSTDNPFEVPGAHPSPALGDARSTDASDRHRLLGAEAWLRAIGLLWMLSGGITLVFYGVSAALSVVGFATTGSANAINVVTQVSAFGIGSLLFGFYGWLGWSMWRLEPGSYGLIQAAALIGVCCGPCSCANVAVPFLLLRDDCRVILTEEHAALRARTPEIQPEITPRALGVLGAYTALVVAMVGFIVAFLAITEGRIGEAFETLRRL